MEIAEALTSFLVPFILGTAGTIVASAFVTSKRLRVELQQESEMLERLPPGARSELRADVRRRALILVSINRFPPITRVEVLALLGFVLCLGAGIYVMYALIADKFEVLELAAGGVLIPGYAVATWFWFHAGWAKRSLSRIRYVHKRLGEAEAQLVARMVTIGYAASMLAFLAALLLSVGIIGAWFYADEALGLGFIVFFSAIMAATSIASVLRLIRSEILVMEVRYALAGYNSSEGLPARFLEERENEMVIL